MKLFFLLSLAVYGCVWHADIARGAPSWLDDERPEKWNNLASDAIQSMLNRQLNSGIAKNVILFLGY
jgi:hypothetical protein